MGSIAPSQHPAALGACRALVEQGFRRIAQSALAASTASLAEQVQACSRTDLRAVLQEAEQLAADPAENLARAWSTAFMARFDAAVLRRAQGAADQLTGQASGAMQAGLSLVSDEELQDTLERSRLAQRVSSRIDGDALAAVRARLAELAGCESFGENDHPLAPAALFEALDEAARQEDAYRAARVLLLEEVAIDLPAPWEALIHETNVLLIAQGILPRLKATVRRDASTPERVRKPALVRGPEVNVSGAGGPGGAGGLAEVPQTAVRFGGRGFVAGPGRMRSSASLGLSGQGPQTALLQGALQQARSGQVQAHRQVLQVLSDETQLNQLAASLEPVKAALLESLAALQHRLQRDADAAPLTAIAEQLHRDGSVLDQVTADIVSMVFDYIDADRRLADSVKRQLLRLQVVAIKAALLDRAFFARRQHPLRQLIDAISDAGADPEADLSSDSALLDGIQSLIDRVIGSFDTSLDVFEQAIAQVQTLILEQAQRRQAARQRAEQKAARQELAALAGDEARDLLSARCDPQTPSPVRSFLHEHWAQVMARARLVADRDAAERAWAVSLKTAELLLWSVRPKQPQEVPRLVGLLPTLLRALHQGLDAIGLPPPIRESFLSLLMQIHTREISQARRGRPLGESAPTVAQPPVPEGRPAIAPLTGAQGKALESLVRGGRYELDTAQGTQLAKLAWISPARRLFIFSAHPEFNLTLEADELARRLNAGALRPVVAGPGVAGILAQFAQSQDAQ